MLQIKQKPSASHLTRRTVTKVICRSYMSGQLCCSLFFCGGERLLVKNCVSTIKSELRKYVLVSDTNEQLGVMSLRSARQIAEERHLDLVEIAANAKPPVCRIMNYGKYRYEQQKREKEAKKKQKVLTLKEVKLRPNIEDHDFYVKMKAAQRFSSMKAVRSRLRLCSEATNEPSRIG